MGECDIRINCGCAAAHMVHRFRINGPLCTRAPNTDRFRSDTEVWPLSFQFLGYFMSIAIIPRPSPSCSLNARTATRNMRSHRLKPLRGARFGVRNVRTCGFRCRRSMTSRRHRCRNRPLLAESDGERPDPESKAAVGAPANTARLQWQSESPAGRSIRLRTRHTPNQHPRSEAREELTPDLSEAAYDEAIADETVAEHSSEI